MYLWKFLCEISFLLRLCLSYGRLLRSCETTASRGAMRGFICEKRWGHENRKNEKSFLHHRKRSRRDTSHKKRQSFFINNWQAYSWILRGFTICRLTNLWYFYIFFVFETGSMISFLTFYFHLHAWTCSFTKNMKWAHYEWSPSNLEVYGIAKAPSHFFSSFLITFVSQHNLHNAVRHRKGAQKSSSIMTRGDGWKIDWKKKSFLDASLIGNISYKK